MAISTNHVGWALYKHRVGPRLLTERTEPFGREGTRAHMKVDYLSPKTILNKHAIIPRWKPCDVADWVERLHDFSPERQSVRMSKITNRGLTRSGTGRYIAVPIYGNSGHKGLSPWRFTPSNITYRVYRWGLKCRAQCAYLISYDAVDERSLTLYVHSLHLLQYLRLLTLRHSTEPNRYNR